MRHRYIGGALLAAAAIVAGPSVAPAQYSAPAQSVVSWPWPAQGQVGPSSPLARAQFTDTGEGGGISAPLNTDPVNPLPTGHAGDAGFYTAAEFVMFNMTRAIGTQVIARRGFYDIDGSITGAPGTLVGSGNPAISASMFSDPTFQPGYKVELGYKFDDGSRIFFNYLQLIDAHYSVGASLVPPFFHTGSTTFPVPGLTNQADTFISSPVYNFNTQFAGPVGKVNGVPDSSAYGIWNAATQMDMKFTQRYQQMQFGLRMPLFQTDYSRVYGIGGGQFSWFFERFAWRTLSLPQDGTNNPTDAANYTNTLSQRMYGPLLGMGHEVFVANQFSVSCDLTGSLMLDVAKERAKYELADESIESKWGRDEFRVVPNANAEVNLWWYPIEGVQIRVGYQAMTFFDTLYMDNPVGFNYGNIEPGYRFKAFRIVHGFNVGIGFFF